MESLSTEDKKRRLLNELASYDSLLVAFSGGADSAFLLMAARRVLGDRVVAATAEAPIFSRREIQGAVDFCKKEAIPLMALPFDPLAMGAFAENTSRRCYYCKKALCALLKEAAMEKNLSHVAHGANADDLRDYRPGLKAADEAGIKSPLLDVGLTKSEIRTLSREMGLSTWDLPSRACMASRVPYGEPVTLGKLEMIEKGEALLEDLGFSQVRLRHHGDIARIEGPASEIPRLLEKGIREDVVERLEKIGFVYVTLDLGGYQTGSMNRKLKEAMQ